MAQLQQGVLVQKAYVVAQGLVDPVTFQISQNAGPFTAPTSNTTTALGGGVYNLSLSASDTSVVGDLVLLFTDNVGTQIAVGQDQVLQFCPGIADIPVNVLQWQSASVAAPDGSGRIEVDVEAWQGTAVPSLVNGSFVPASVQDWLGTAPQNLNGNRLVQVDVEQWLSSNPQGLTGSGYVQSDLLTWQGSSPQGLASGGYLQVDVEEWKGTSPSSLTGAGYIMCDVEYWTGAVPNNLDGGNVPSNLRTWLGTAPVVLNPDQLVQVDVTEWNSVNVAATPPEMNLVDSPNATALDAIARIVWTLTDALETGLNPIEALRILAASQAGRTTLVGDTFTIFDPSGTVQAIVATVDANGQRLTIANNLAWPGGL